jgi:hypothetical protein
MGGVTLTAPDSFGWSKGATLAFDIINTSGSLAQNPGSNGTVNNGVTNTGNGNGATTYYAGVTLPTPIAALKFGASFDYLNARDISQNEWAAAVYSTYQFNDKLSLNLRAEYLDAQSLDASGAYTPTSTGYNQAHEITATIQYALWANVLTRLEVRWDHSNHTGAGGYYSNVSSGVGTPQADAFLLAAQAIYTF